jgi:hypothetical protein
MREQLPQMIVDFIAKNPKYRGKDVKIDTTPYWSTVRYQFSIAGLLAAGVARQAFSYAVGGDRTPAGFTAVAGAANAATMADTNLMQAGQTRLNSDIFVTGVAAYITPDSDAALVKRVVRESVVTLSTDGQNTTPLAPLERLPAGGGLFGVGRSAIKVPAINVAGLVDGGEGAAIQFVNNGAPTAGNFFLLNSPILWSGQQGTDSNFRLNFTMDRAISEPVAAARAAGAGISAYTPPAALGDPGTFVDVRVALKVWAISLLSVNG